MDPYPEWETSSLREMCFHACTGNLDKVRQCVENAKMLSTAPEDEGMLKEEFQHFIWCPIAFYAATNGHIDIVEYFIGKGHDILVSVTDKNTIWYKYKNSRTGDEIWMTRGLLQDDAEWGDYDFVERLDKGKNLLDFLKQMEAFSQMKALRQKGLIK